MFINDLNSIRDRFKALSSDILHIGQNVAYMSNDARERAFDEARSDAYQLGVDLDKAVKKRTTTTYTENSEDLSKLLEGVVACVEADEFTYSTLWRDHAIGGKDYGRHNTHRFTWDNRTVTSVIVGNVEDRPVNVQISLAVIGGVKVMFYHGCSTLVDHDMIRNFLNIAMPSTARDANGRINNTNADGFVGVIPRPQKAA